MESLELPAQKPHRGGSSMNGSEKNGKPAPTKSWRGELAAIVLSGRALAVFGVLASVVALRLGSNWYEHRTLAAVAPTVGVTRPALRPVDRSISLPGDVEAIEQARLYAHISGYLKKISVDEGDTVKAGELLADIDAPDVVQEYNKAKADATLKEETLKRYRELLSGKVISQQEFDTLDAEDREARARLDNASANMEYTRIRAPFSGSIARRYAYPGDFISEASRGGEQRPIFLMVNESRLRVSVNIPQNETAKVHLGYPVDIGVDSMPGKQFHGTISRIDAVLDETTKTQRVLIDIDNPDLKLRAGMFASVVLHVEHVDAALTIPRQALQGTADQRFVYVVADGHARARPVALGTEEQEFVQVLSGLSPSDSVVVTGGQSLVDGAAVEAVEGAR
ncbi:MAG: efflux RND transporter periplasmic adaptor subunit [Elusimicrobiota bacterium]